MCALKKIGEDRESLLFEDMTLLSNKINILTRKKNLGIREMTTEMISKTLKTLSLPMRTS